MCARRLLLFWSQKAGAAGCATEEPRCSSASRESFQGFFVAAKAQGKRGLTAIGDTTTAAETNIAEGIVYESTAQIASFATAAELRVEKICTRGWAQESDQSPLSQVGLFGKNGGEVDT